MTKKLLLKILSNPKNVSVKETETLLFQFGFKKIRHKGSHAFYYNQNQKIRFSFPHRKPVKICYIKNLIKLLNEI